MKQTRRIIKETLTINKQTRKQQEEQKKPTKAQPDTESNNKQN